MKYSYDPYKFCGEVEKLYDILEWVGEYSWHSPFSCNIESRLLISLYQAKQGLQTFSKIGPNDMANEAFSGSIIHLFIYGHLFGNGILEDFAKEFCSTPWYSKKIDCFPGVNKIDYYSRRVFFLYGNLGEQLIYKNHSGGRNLRFDPKITKKSIIDLVSLTLGMIPIDRRKHAFWNAIEIMTHLK